MSTSGSAAREPGCGVEEAKAAQLDGFVGLAILTRDALAVKQWWYDEEGGTSYRGKRRLAQRGSEALETLPRSANQSLPHGLLT